MVNFYSAIAEWYDSIFPLSPEEVSFILKEISESGSENVLDMGCATGSLSMEIAKAGYSVTAFDLNSEMIGKAFEKTESTGHVKSPVFLEADMRHLKRNFPEDSFGFACSLGNTLPHLTEESDIELFFKGIAHVLRPGGRFVLQILNYDYILKQGLECLPVIDNGAVRFERYYDFLDDGLIAFNTVLTVKGDSERVVNNSVRLKPMGLHEVMKRLVDAGFQVCGTYSGYGGEPPADRSLPLIVTAVRKD